MDQKTDALLRELLCEYLGILPEALSSEGSAVDAGGFDAPASETRQREEPPIPFVRSELIPAARARGRLLRTAALSPYQTQLIVQDALRAGAGARLAVELADVPDPSVCNALRDELSRLTRRGIHVRVRCNRGECRHGTPGAAA